MKLTDSLTADWNLSVAKLGGEERLGCEARETGAFRRPRQIKNPVDLLRLALAYCLGGVGLRSIAAWAGSIGLADISDVGVLQRLRNVGPWLEVILARLLVGVGESRGSDLAPGRLIRLVDATNVRKAGKEARQTGKLWRIHAVLDLPTERFSAFELTDEKGAERLDRAAVIAGEIRIADRVHCQPDQIAPVLAAGGDVVVRAAPGQVRWCDENKNRINVLALLQGSRSGLIDQPVGMLARGRGEQPLMLRLVATRLPPDKATKAVEQARATARKNGNKVKESTLVAAEWVLLVTSLDAVAYPAEKVSALYRLRWRVEIGFKRVKSLGGLDGPPGECPKVAKAVILSHLILDLLTEAHIGALGDSPRRAYAPLPAGGAAIGC